MKVLAITAMFLTTAVALPQDRVCPSPLYSVAQCCTTDVLNIASIDCVTPSSANDMADFKASCAGGQAQCCSAPAAGQGVLCITPVGV